MEIVWRIFCLINVWEERLLIDGHLFFCRSLSSWLWANNLTSTHHSILSLLAAKLLFYESLSTWTGLLRVVLVNLLLNNHLLLSIVLRGGQNHFLIIFFNISTNNSVCNLLTWLLFNCFSLIPKLLCYICFDIWRLFANSLW